MCREKADQLTAAERKDNFSEVVYDGLTEDQAVAEKYEVDTIPTLLFFRDGKPVDSIVGYGNVGYSELMEFVNKNNVK
ncbi:thioredoxin family protein, partial [Dialister invisus]|uniref:thioredoxin family protein n=1 Tax=Dialister invisus TaxID=218538 RepID=UPI003FD7279B